MKTHFTERKYKKEYQAIKNELETLINQSFDKGNWWSPKGSKKIANILRSCLETIEECYTHYELKLHQIVSLLHLLEKECNTGELEADFNGALYNVSSRIIQNTGKYNEWRVYSLLIKDQYIM